MTHAHLLATCSAIGLLCAALAATGPTAASAASTTRAGSAAPGTLQLFAGGGTTEGDDVPAAGAVLFNPTALAHDSAGNVFVADAGGHGVRRVDARSGAISSLTGRFPAGTSLVDEDITPVGLAVDAAGDVYVASDTKVVEFTHDGQVRFISGLGGPPERTGLRANSIALDPAGNLYLSLPDNGVAPRIMKLTPDGTLSRFAGGGQVRAGDGGPALAAQLSYPNHLLRAADGALLFTDRDRVRRVSPDGRITTVAGGGTSRCEGVPAAAADLQPGLDIALDGAGRLLISEWYLDRVQRLQDDGTLSDVLGRGSPVGATGAVLDVPAATSTVHQPGALDMLPDGRLLLTERSQSRVLAVLAGSTQATAHGFAGTGRAGVAGRAGDGGPACAAELAYPTGLARAADGSTYVADYQNSQVRRITPDGRIRTVAGTGRPGYSGDGGSATAAQLDHPRSVAVDPAGRLLIADVVNNKIRRVDPATGIITTLAGTGQWGASGDGGPATGARLAGPRGVAVSPDGTVWVADTGNHTLRKISPDGTISTAAGTGTAGAGGDGGPATAAQLSSPRAVAVDGRALYLSDPGTSSVRQVDLVTGTIRTLAGPATGTPLSNPAGLLPTPAGLLVADAGSNRILRLGPTGAVSVVAGTGRTGPPTRDDGLRPITAADQTPLAQPQGLALRADGSLLVADTAHHQVLRITRP